MKEQELANKIIEKLNTIKNESNELLEETYGMISRSNNSEWIEKFDFVSDEFDDILKSITKIERILKK